MTGPEMRIEVAQVPRGFKARGKPIFWHFHDRIPNQRIATVSGLGTIAWITKMPRKKHPYEVEFFTQLPRRAFDKLSEARSFVAKRVAEIKIE